jgi:hypothetical protein
VSLKSWKFEQLPCWYIDFVKLKISKVGVAPSGMIFIPSFIKIHNFTEGALRERDTCQEPMLVYKGRKVGFR